MRVRNSFLSPCIYLYAFLAAPPLFLFFQAKCLSLFIYNTTALQKQCCVYKKEGKEDGLINVNRVIYIPA